jgi:glutaredoxin-like protein NrdH
VLELADRLDLGSSGAIRGGSNPPFPTTKEKKSRVNNMTKKHIAGRKVGKVTLYALSTCVWCNKTKKLLNELGVDYDYTDVDLLGGAEREAVIETIKKYNPPCSFPTLVINDKKSIVGFKENEIREALKG